MSAKYTVLLDNDCSIRVYQSFVAIFQKYFLICWHYAQCFQSPIMLNIIGCSLYTVNVHTSICKSMKHHYLCMWSLGGQLGSSGKIRNLCKELLAVTLQLAIRLLSEQMDVILHGCILA